MRPVLDHPALPFGQGQGRGEIQRLSAPSQPCTAALIGKRQFMPAFIRDESRPRAAGAGEIGFRLLELVARDHIVELARQKRTGLSSRPLSGRSLSSTAKQPPIMMRPL
ncbi:hypothetical protein ACFFX0_30010 [Citricoccus parietis]|uniref:Uncharacterized protein n=1 Tax=Citricoccus parietis TaxID=592307 RepID=A0ABV5G8C6_9MICC